MPPMGGAAAYSPCRTCAARSRAWPGKKEVMALCGLWRCSRWQSGDNGHNKTRKKGRTNFGGVTEKPVVNTPRPRPGGPSSCLHRFRPASVLQHITWIVLLTIVPVSRRALLYFECVETSRYGDVLRSDMSFQCHTNIHLLLILSSLSYFLFVSMGVPVAMLLFLRWKKRVLLNEKVASTWMHARSTLQYLNGEHKHDTVSW